MDNRFLDLEALAMRAQKMALMVVAAVLAVLVEAVVVLEPEL